jgi:hypothetical protein
MSVRTITCIVGTYYLAENLLHIEGAITAALKREQIKQKMVWENNEPLFLLVRR